ncbi:acyltransferase family protein [Bradyrhizobium lablabi]|uniref:acyltransferase family protein n=1 Tax=Bradyrhizobium lablabi TaxID=722472 RepID=UPI00090C2BD6|nr:acyltransferase [Bradyrhizobium lablabi]SHM81623.1 Peptidoglycan/LPS O-acetylase OafA/YrhL, contains acyltransferase and SGNH-hydrolase domains [Bradyrhizobium lablabi]
MNISSDDRLHFLDGLRGWGALVVLLAHVFGEGFPINERVTAVLIRMGIFNAGLAVWIFFIVSGFSLSITFCRHRDPQVLVNTALGRYIRLAVPILGTALLLYLFFAIGLVPKVENRLSLFKSFLPISPTIWEVTRFALFDVFLAYNPAATLIAPLWAMPFELWGSALVLGTLLVAGRLKRRGWVYTVLGMLAYLIHPIYAAFIVGLVLSEIHASGVLKGQPAWSVVSLTLLAIGVIASGFLPDSARHTGIYLVVASVLTTASVFGGPISNFLSGGLSRFLGRISYPLYLIHGPLLLAYANNAYRWIESPSGYQKLLLNLSTVVVCIAAAALLVPMDRLGIRSAKWVAAFLTTAGGETNHQAEPGRSGLRP